MSEFRKTLKKVNKDFIIFGVAQKDKAMAKTLMRPIPLGTSSFKKLREVNQIYVDKTDSIFSVAREDGKFFLTRPRRFGKSLLISIFESLFASGLKNFQGLKIEKLWKESKTYQVIRLDFSEVRDFNSAEEFSKRLTSLIARKFAFSGFVYKESRLFSIFDQLSDWLETRPVSSLVILVDEYDSPLTACLTNPALFELVEMQMASFYAVLKANDRALRFVFITGITRFNNTNIFSGFNNLTDISFMSKYGSLVGFTPSEVTKYFGDYLRYSSTMCGVEQPTLLEALEKQYSGFCFEKTGSQKVFSPWSLLNFFRAPEEGLKDYWFETGGKPSVLIKYLQTCFLKNPKEYGKEQTIVLSTLTSSSDPENLSDVGLLTQAGYLTIKSVRYGNTVFVGYPNKEVKRATAQLYLEQLLKGRTAGQVGAGAIVDTLIKEGAEALFHILNRLFASIDYIGYPIKDEYSLRAFIQIYFAGAGLDPIVEHHNAHGRSDLEVKAGNRHWILELKVVRKGENPEHYLDEGVFRVRARNYGSDSSSAEVIRIVLVYSLEKREFVKWEQC